MGRVRLIGSCPLLNLSETLAFGKKVASQIKPNTIIALSGDLGAGKTSFVQGLALGLGINEPVQSPTFVLLNLYEGSLPLFHFDLYRLKGESDFIQLGFQEYFHSQGICAIEWPCRISSLLPNGTLSIHFKYVDQYREAEWKIL